MGGQCSHDQKAQFYYCPSIEAAVLLTVLFGIAAIVHTAQAAFHKKSFCWVIIMSSIWQLGAFISRCLSIYDPLSNAKYNASFALTLLAPLWTNAFVFMCLGRMVYTYLPEKRLLRIPARWLGVIFVCLDITSFIVQLLGVVESITNIKNQAQSHRGLHIYTGGVAMQEFFILCFTAVSFLFLRRLRALPRTERTIRGERFMYVMFMALFLITFRIIYRIVEFSAGLASHITVVIETHEGYLYGFDALPMYLAIILFHFFHPGTIFGPGRSWPSRKEKKAMRAEEKRRAESGATESSGTVRLGDA